jgi:hypothetical protein
MYACMNERWEVAKNAVAKFMHSALVCGEGHCSVFTKQEIDGTNPI